MIAWTPPLRMEILQESRDPNSPNEFRRKDRDSLKAQRLEVRDPIALMYPSSQSLRRANRVKVLRLEFMRTWVIHMLGLWIVQFLSIYLVYNEALFYFWR